MDSNKLKSIIDSHHKWLNGENNGERADLRGADLRNVDLRYTILSGAILRGAILRDADLRDADLRDFQICPEEGAFIGWKKLSHGLVAKIEIPAEARRTSSIVGRKCRAAFVRTSALYHTGMDTCEWTGVYNPNTIYKIGCLTFPDKYNDDIRLECTNGIHFFMTKKEAEEY